METTKNIESTEESIKKEQPKNDTKTRKLEEPDIKKVLEPEILDL